MSCKLLPATKKIILKNAASASLQQVFSLAFDLIFKRFNLNFPCIYTLKQLHYETSFAPIF